MLGLFQADAADILRCGHIHSGLEFPVQLDLADAKFPGNHIGAEGLLVKIGEDYVRDGGEDGLIGLFYLLAGNLFHGCLGGLAVADHLGVAAEDSLYAGHKVAGMEGLGHVCVNAVFKGLDLGVHCRFSGEKDERNVPKAAVFPHLCPQLQSVHSRHGQV